MVTANPAKATVTPVKPRSNLLPKNAGLVIAFLVAALVFPKNTWAASGNVQVCQPGAACHIGEFLYDDSYAPLNTTSCTITSKYPNGTVYLTDQAMTSAADGWYSYQIGTAPATEGVYRTQISCIVGEKTFSPASINTTTERITVGKNIATDTIITFSSTGTLPAELVVGTRYYAINIDTVTIQVSASSGGAAINLTGQGTGTHTINSNIMSLDKTFEVKADLTSNGIAASVWGYSDRSLSTFGTLIADIWNYSTRSLTTFGSLATDVWTSATRTLTAAGLSSGSLAVQTDVTSARDSIKGASNKDLSNVSSEVSGVQTDTTAIKSDTTTLKSDTTTLKSDTTTLKSDTTSIISTVNSIYTDSQALRTDVTSILGKWGTSSAADIISNIDTVSTKLGTNADPDTTATVFGRIEYVRNKWGTQTAQTIYDKANSAATTVTSLRAELDYNGKTTTAYQDLQSLLGYVDSLESSVGLQGDASTASTLFGRMKKIQEKVDTLSVINADLRGILDSWGVDNNIAALYTKVVDIRGKLDTIGTVSSTTNLSQTTINNIENISSVLNQTTITNTVLKELKNEVLTLSAVTQVNRDLIEKSVNKPIINTFLLEGSVIFKSLIVNPSSRISQSVDFEYYLPEELSKEDILELDPSLTLSYNSERNQYLVTGTFTLAASETKTASVKTEDIWQISQDEVNTVRKQAEELAKVLNVNTAYYAQGVTLKSDIDVSLNKVVEIQKNKVTPEAKIKAYREAKIEFEGAKNKTEKLKELVAQAGSAGNLLGFVGGSQAIAVWGLIIIMSAGFVFLALYMRTLRAHETRHEPEEATVVNTNNQKTDMEQRPLPNEKAKSWKTFLKLASLVLITMSLSAGVSGTIAFKVLQATSQKEKTEVAKVEPASQVLGVSYEAQQPQVEDQTCNFIPEGEVKGQKALLILGETKKADVYCFPSSQSVRIITFASPEKVEKLGEVGQWAFVSFSQARASGAVQRGWVRKEHVVVTSVSDSKPRGGAEEIDLSPLGVKQIIVGDTSTGYLNVRKTPSGEEIARVESGERLDFIQEQNGWIEIQLADGSTGWVVKKFTKLAE